MQLESEKNCDDDDDVNACCVIITIKKMLTFMTHVMI